MNRRNLILAATAVLIAAASACSDITAPRPSSAAIAPHHDALTCQVSNGSQVCTGS